MKKCFEINIKNLAILFKQFPFCFSCFVKFCVKSNKEELLRYAWIGLRCSESCQSYDDFFWSDLSPMDYEKFAHGANLFNSSKCGITTRYEHAEGGLQFWDWFAQAQWLNELCSSNWLSICKAGKNRVKTLFALIQQLNNSFPGHFDEEFK